MCVCARACACACAYACVCVCVRREGPPPGGTPAGRDPRREGSPPGGTPAGRDPRREGPPPGGTPAGRDPRREGSPPGGIPAGRDPRREGSPPGGTPAGRDPRREGHGSRPAGGASDSRRGAEEVRRRRPGSKAPGASALHRDQCSPVLRAALHFHFTCAGHQPSAAVSLAVHVVLPVICSGTVHLWRYRRRKSRSGRSGKLDYSQIPSISFARPERACAAVRIAARRPAFPGTLAPTRDKKPSVAPQSPSPENCWAAWGGGRRSQPQRATHHPSNRQRWDTSAAEHTQRPS
eukprot:gene23153-biopygen8832